jgi:hypothetical protein
MVDLHTIFSVNIKETAGETVLLHVDGFSHWVVRQKDAVRSRLSLLEL